MPTVDSRVLQLSDAGAGVLMSNVLSVVTTPPAAAGLCMLLGGFADGDSITGHAAAVDDMVAAVAGAASEWPTDEDVQTWALFFFLVWGCMCVCVYILCVYCVSIIVCVCVPICVCYHLCVSCPCTYPSEQFCSFVLGWFSSQNVSGYVAASEKPESSGTDALDRKTLEQVCQLCIVFSLACVL